MVHKQLYYEIYYNFLSIVNDDNDDVNTKYKNAKLSSLIRLYLFHQFLSLNNIDPKILGKPTGVKNISQYIKRKPLPGTIFSELVLGTPFNSRAAIVYNDLLKFKKIDNQYESILEGDKISVINLKNNPYHVETIGLPNGSKVPPELQKFVELKKMLKVYIKKLQLWFQKRDRLQGNKHPKHSAPPTGTNPTPSPTYA